MFDFSCKNNRFTFNYFLIPAVADSIMSDEITE